MNLLNAKVSAYIICYNNAAIIERAIASIRRQSRTVDEIVVVDDGSDDQSGMIAQSLGARVVRLATNCGRGNARAVAMNEVKNELVLSVDAGTSVGSDFVEKAVEWFANENVAAVFGRLILVNPTTTVERWAARHIYRKDSKLEVSPKASLLTGGTMVRKSAVMDCGSFNTSLRHSEDRELGQRLLQNNYDVVFDPKLEVFISGQLNLPIVLERYWRWHAGAMQKADLLNYLKQIKFSLKVMAWQDLKANDPAAAAISILTPHYQMWRSSFSKTFTQSTNPIVR